MSGDRMAALFVRFRDEGDGRALEQVFEALAPELLALARRLCARGEEAEDLVQTTFLVAISRRDRFDATRPLRPWLVGILAHKARADRRRPVEGAPEPLDTGRGPQGEAQAQEFARDLAQALERLPPRYREVLREHFYEGRPPAEIARLRGEPQGTVRSRLHRALRLLRGFLPAGLAGALAWIGPSRPALARIRSAVLHEAQAGGATASAAAVPPSVLVLAGLALLGTLAGYLLFWRTDASGSAVPDAGREGRLDAAVAALPVAELGREPIDLGEGPLAEAAAEPTASEEPAGSLLLRVRYPDDSPAGAVELRVYAWGDPGSGKPPRLEPIRVRADESGEVLLEPFPSGRALIIPAHGAPAGRMGYGAEIRDGERTELVVTLAPGVAVHGLVTDEDGQAMPGAEVRMSWSPTPDEFLTAAHTDAAGRFHVHDVDHRRWFGARAAGHASPRIQWLGSGGLRAGGRADLHLVVSSRRGTIRGTVSTEGEARLPGATVQVHAPGDFARIQRGMLSSMPESLRLQADEQGSFSFHDLPRIELLLVASTHGFAHWSRHIDLSAEPDVELAVRMERGVALAGRVRFVDGRPAAGVVLEAMTPQEAGGALRMAAQAGADGSYRFEHLPAGLTEVRVSTGPARHIALEVELDLEPGVEARWDAVLDDPGQLVHVLQDPAGNPLVGWFVRLLPGPARALVGALEDTGEPLESDEAPRPEAAAWLARHALRDSGEWLVQARTDAEGRFVIRDCPARHVAIELSRPDDPDRWPVATFEGLHPGEAPRVLAVAGHEAHGAQLLGTLRGPADEPLGSAEIFAVARSGRDGRVLLDPATGTFRVTGLPGGTYDLLAWAGGHPPAWVATITLGAGAARELGVLRLPP